MNTPIAPGPAAVRRPAHVPLVALERAGITEGVHHGSVVVLDPAGAVAWSAGDIDAAMYPRSALKPVQAAAMVRAGLPLDGELLALAAASHSGEPEHLAGARRILALGGFGEDALRNVPDLPYGEAARAAWLRAGHGPSPLAQNCSGKHAAMLVTCGRNGWPAGDYPDPGHPLQRAVAAEVERLTGERIAAVTADGCGAPLFSVSLRGLARAAAALVTAAPDSPEGRVADAMRAHPGMVAGPGRDVTGLMRAVPGLLAKDGFEGVQIAALPDGWAVAVKIAAGTDRARMPATVAALLRCGVEPALLAPFGTAPVYGGTEVVGRLAPLPELLPGDGTPG